MKSYKESTISLISLGDFALHNLNASNLQDIYGNFFNCALMVSKKVGFKQQIYSEFELDPGCKEFYTLKFACGGLVLMVNILTH